MINFCLLFLISLNVFAYDFINLADNDYFIISDKITNSNVSEDSSFLDERKKIMNIALGDEKRIINETFSISPYFSDKVRFWLKIYTVYDSSQVVIHDKNNLDIIYKEFDFSNLWSSNLSIFAKSNIQSKIVREKSQQIKDELRRLKSSSYSEFKNSQIFKILKNANVKISENKEKRIEQLDNLFKNIRAQTGQRNKQELGILNYSKYDEFMTSIFKLFNLPHELLGIPFLESSFNTQAHSKVGAKGIWQIMPFIARKMLPYDKYTDGRNSPIISTLASAHLLKQNFKILKRWDLAVTAYNSGTKHIINASKKLKIDRKNLSLETIFQKYKHPHLGFASQNFYSEFLALLRVLEYRKLIFSLGNNNKSQTNFYLYLSKCSLRPEFIFKNFNSFGKVENGHFLNPKKKYPKGSIFVSNRKVNSKYFLEIKNEWLLKNYPRNLSKYVKRYNCSTK